ncbi:hypothetical protein HPB47_025834 [Ixodes persulcatus]|uniref:Uncharacterized protein n=1 Tax=Ixodes persulcatus TaxID=34615 RepID=A0AC60Q2C0_IXOPE|nr:hypothetical protein HPB47_025834 [Ixodes persulcatus]
MTCSLRLIGLAGGGARTERRRIPAGPINCREHAMTLCLFRCLIGPSAHYIGRARTEAETKYRKQTIPLNVRGVIHGITAEITDEYLSQHVPAEKPRLLGICRLGRTNTILLSIEGPRLPRYAFIRCGVYPIFPQRARCKQCKLCHGIGHRGDVKLLPYNHDLLTTPLDCDPLCFNCNGEHPPSSPACPARTKADEDAQKRQRIPSRHRFQAVAQPPQDLQNWPACLPQTASTSSRHRGAKVAA